jgi:hypothetical protein
MYLQHGHTLVACVLQYLLLVCFLWERITVPAIDCTRQCPLATGGLAAGATKAVTLIPQHVRSLLVLGSW